MFIAEACLLQAVRDQLVTDLALKDEQCQVELDGMLPDYAPKLFIAVSPGGIQAGPHHKSSGGVIDLLINVRVTVYNRVAEVARDRRRSTFIQLLTGLAPTLEKVTRSLDNDYGVTDSAVAIIADTIAGYTTPAVPPTQISDNETGKFPEPFRHFSPDLSCKMVYKEPYDAAQMAGPPADPIVAMGRSIMFLGARYMQVRATWAPS